VYSKGGGKENTNLKGIIAKYRRVIGGLRGYKDSSKDAINIMYEEVEDDGEEESIRQRNRSSTGARGVRQIRILTRKIPSLY